MATLPLSFNLNRTMAP